MVYNLLINSKERYDQTIREDLCEKMVFLGGPRQVGKTTFARDIVGSHYASQYYTWDRLAERKEALNGIWPPDMELIILDEFHKYPRWKNWVKGEYDTHKEKYKFLLTGSARLDIYRRGGDSLQGRYHYHRLHPFSVAELLKKTPSFKPPDEPMIPEKGLGLEIERSVTGSIPVKIFIIAFGCLPISLKGLQV